MTTGQLVRRSLVHYWRTNVAVVLGVATAVAVLAGALLVGHSVRRSLANLVEQRIGATDLIVASPQFFREQLAADIAGDARFASSFSAAAPLIVAEGAVTDQESGRRAGRVKVYGVDERFWRFHGRSPVPLEAREAIVSTALAREIGAREGAAVLVRVQRPADVPLESLHGKKDAVGRTLRLTTRGVLDAAALGDFSLDAQQGDVFAVFVPLARLRDELEVGERVNTVLVSRVKGQFAAPSALTEILKAVARPEDVGFTLRASDDGKDVIVGSSAGLLDDPQAAATRKAVPAGREVFTYLANTMRVGGREVPYSLVTGIDLGSLAIRLKPDATDIQIERDSIVLNSWTANDLQAKTGDALEMEFFVWVEPGQLVTRRASFHVAGIVPIEAGGPDLAPEFPGISNTTNLRDWDPPFPLDLRRVRPVDEDYWDRHRTTPKAFVPLDTARTLWGSRYGSLTSIRAAASSTSSAAEEVPRVGSALRQAIDLSAFSLGARDLRSESLAASQGATDFGEYFVYFSFFLVVSALVLVVLFFKLGVEQRVREVGLLRALGLSPRAIRRLFTTEGVLLAVAGSLIGIAGAVAYASLIIGLLTTRWVGAVGTTALALNVALGPLIVGIAGGVVSATICIWWTLRGLARVSERSLLAGELTNATVEGRSGRFARFAAPLLAVLGVMLAALGGSGLIPAAAGFFGAGAALLVAALTFAGVFLRRPARHAIDGMPRLAARTASYRPGRSVLSMSVIAAATFILVTVDAFRRDGAVNTTDRGNGTGGYALMVRMLLPSAHDPNSPEGRAAMNLTGLNTATTFEPFRVRAGDDASCLNLYQPANPRIIAPRDAFLAEGRFAFQSSAATTDAERQNPWLLLNRDEPDQAVPVIADANSMMYVLHRAVGEEMVLTNAGAPIRLRFVASLRDSIFQSELVMSEGNFRRLFPDQQGFQLMLVDTSDDPAKVSQEIEQSLADDGADAVGTGEYLASFHRVENTYLATFQTLGGLGLLLGTIGLATVLLRNVLERRRELALLAAVGYRRSHFLLMAIVENLVIVVGGLAIGAVCAALAIAPAVAERGARLPLSSGALLLLFSVFVVAMVSTVVAMTAATRTPILQALRSE